MFWQEIFDWAPYIALTIFVLGTITAFFNRKYGITSHSTGFLENKELFWGSVPWHYGILIVLFGHLLGFVAPSAVLSATSNFSFLVLLGSIAFAAGLLSAWGIAVLFFRRIFNKYVLAETGFFNVLIILLLLFQTISGLYISWFDKWGMNWYSSNISAYLLSIFKFAPQGNIIAEFPVILKLHALNLFLMLALLPFTKLIHILTAPVKYLFRRPIQYIWNR